MRRSPVEDFKQKHISSARFLLFHVVSVLEGVTVMRKRTSLPVNQHDDEGALREKIMFKPQ